MIPIIDFIPARKAKTFDDIPQTELFRMTVKLYLVGALVWDYTDTVIDISIQMRIAETKKVTRAIRELKRDYEYIRSRDLDADHFRKEWELTELFESINKPHFSRLCLNLKNEIHRDTSLNPDFVTLVESVQIALTVLDAMKLYAAQCDAFIRKYYPSAPHSILPDHFARLSTLLPLYAGDCYNKNSKTRQLTARILLNEINRIELYDDDRKI